jgi:hypothetical protein
VAEQTLPVNRDRRGSSLYGLLPTATVPSQKSACISHRPLERKGPAHRGPARSGRSIQRVTYSGPYSAAAPSAGGGSRSFGNLEMRRLPSATAVQRELPQVRTFFSRRPLCPRERCYRAPFTVFLPHATSPSAKAPPLEQYSSERQTQPAHRTLRSLD